MKYFNPVDIRVDTGCRVELSSDCSGRSVLVVCSKSALSRLSGDVLLAGLSCSKRIYFEHGFSSNPSLQDLISITQKAQEMEIDMIVGIGGGSALDVAKILSVSIPSLEFGHDVLDLIENPSVLDQIGPIETVLLPTTAGTGSEVTPFSTVWDYQQNRKLSLAHPKVFCSKAVVDPDLLIGSPFNVMLSTAFDALNQAFESIWNVNANEISRLYAQKAIVFALRAFPLIRKVSDLRYVREDFAKASLFAGVAISQTRTSICHSISYPLTLNFGVPHGLACAFSMRAVLEFNRCDIQESISAIASALGTCPIDSVNRLFVDFEVDEMLRGYLGSQAAVKSVLNEMKTAGRFDNNIKKCDGSALDNIITESCLQAGLKLK